MNTSIRVTVFYFKLLLFITYINYYFPLQLLNEKTTRMYIKYKSALCNKKGTKWHTGGILM